MLTGLLITRIQRFFVFLFFLFGIYQPLVAQVVVPPENGISSFDAQLINIEAASNETFRYNATIHNASKDAMVYELKADLPSGWLATFRTQGSQITSLRIDPAKTQDVSLEFNASFSAKPGKYTIPVKAISQEDTLTLDLEAVVKGSYQVELTTPTGRLSEEVVSGSSKEILLTIKNIGTLPLNDIELTSHLPTQWECKFEPAKFEQIEPGKSEEITATLRVPDKTIAGDYVARLQAKNPNANVEASFRIIVKTSLLSGWIGILIILLALGLIYGLIRKYGRR